ncbi:ATPase subunit b [Intoshia linei]|uniref:ATPase subunit b n=1 Tax=Intoshia linei TaxID=1819745 RepID=A0A177B077_9BILA|nr:ATPase subunit b [Intoshia linei]
MGSNLVKFAINQERGYIKNLYSRISIKEFTENVKNANKILYGPERDNVNYPILRSNPTRPPVRLGLIPKSWFDFMYDKTGVTGPYILIWGSMITYLSKEFLVINVPAIHIMLCCVVTYVALNKFSQPVQSYFLKMTEENKNRLWVEPNQHNKDRIVVKKLEINELVNEVKSVFYEIDAKKNNITLQLEAKYRQNLLAAHNETIKRLNYQVDKCNAIEKFKVDHMVRWIRKNAIESITPQQEKENIMACIRKIQQLAPSTVSMSCVLCLTITYRISQHIANVKIISDEIFRRNVLSSSIKSMARQIIRIKTEMRRINQFSDEFLSRLKRLNIISEHLKNGLDDFLDNAHKFAEYMNHDKLKITKLRAELKKFDLPTVGTKRQLYERLKTHLETTKSITEQKETTQLENEVETLATDNGKDDVEVPATENKNDVEMADTDIEKENDVAVPDAVNVEMSVVDNEVPITENGKENVTTEKIEPQINGNSDVACEETPVTETHSDSMVKIDESIPSTEQAVSTEIIDYSHRVDNENQGDKPSAIPASVETEANSQNPAEESKKKNETMDIDLANVQTDKVDPVVEINSQVDKVNNSEMLKNTFVQDSNVVHDSFDVTADYDPLDVEGEQEYDDLTNEADSSALNDDIDKLLDNCKTTEDSKKNTTNKDVSNQYQKPRVREKTPIPEYSDDWIDSIELMLDKGNSDLHLVIDSTGYEANVLSQSHISSDLFACARTNYGVSSGKFMFEVKILNKMMPTSRNKIRIGVSTLESNLMLGMSSTSFCYENTGKSINGKEILSKGIKFGDENVVGCYVDMESDPITISYSVNGAFQGIFFKVKKSYLNGKALFPHVSTKCINFTINVGQVEPYYETDQDGYLYINTYPIDKRTKAPSTPKTFEDCEFVLLAGLPGAGKSHWVRNYLKKNNKNYYIMNYETIMYRLLGNSYASMMNDANHKNISRVLSQYVDLAIHRKRNYILEQTNCLETSQKRKVKIFNKWNIKMVYVIPKPNDYKVYCDTQLKLRPEKRFGRKNIGLMKTDLYFSDTLCENIEYVGMTCEEMKEQVKKYNDEGREKSESSRRIEIKKDHKRTRRIERRDPKSRSITTPKRSKMSPRSSFARKRQEFDARKNIPVYSSPLTRSRYSDIEFPNREFQNQEKLYDMYNRSRFEDSYQNVSRGSSKPQWTPATRPVFDDSRRPLLSNSRRYNSNDYRDAETNYNARNMDRGGMYNRRGNGNGFRDFNPNWNFD